MEKQRVVLRLAGMGYGDRHFVLEVWAQTWEWIRGEDKTPKVPRWVKGGLWRRLYRGANNASKLYSYFYHFGGLPNQYVWCIYQKEDDLLRHYDRNELPCKPSLRRHQLLDPRKLISLGWTCYHGSPVRFPSLGHTRIRQRAEYLCMGVCSGLNRPSHLLYLHVLPI